MTMNPISRKSQVSRLYRICLPTALVVFLLLPMDSLFAATAETILIRQTLEKDRSGRRRGDAELVLSAYDEDRFVAYDAAGSIDARAWSVLHDSRESMGQALEADLSVRRYDIKRSVVFINVWKDKAFVTTLDSGAVIDAATGARSPYAESLLWTFRKLDEEWLATGVIVSLGDLTTGPATGRVEADEVAESLMDHVQQWNDDSHSGITGTLSEEAVIIDSYFSPNPALWLIIFSDREEIDEWLDDRLAAVDYSIDRKVEHAVVTGDEAVAVTRDRITATYSSGAESLTEERLSTWFLTRSGGSWVVTWAWWKTKPFQSGATALH
jgi:hypothetical protein